MQGPSREVCSKRLDGIAIFYGVPPDDATFKTLKDTYLDKTLEIPEPSSDPYILKSTVALLETTDIDPVILEDKWWTRNSLYVAHASQFGSTKLEWSALVRYILSFKGKNET